MNRRMVTLLCALCLGLPAMSGNYDTLVRRNLWNDGINAAGLRCDSLSFGNAQLEGKYTLGDYRNFSDPKTELGIGAIARGVRHERRFSMAGTFGFRQREWNSASGSMLMDADFYPFDILEFTPGRKTFQTYTLSGAIGVDISSRVRLGGRIDFESTNASKRKDLRYTGYMLDLRVAPSVQILLDKTDIGVSIVYVRKTQTVTAEQVGSAASVPYVFFDEGCMAGNYLEWTGSSSHLKENGISGFPTSSNSLGFALQLQAGPVYADASFSTFLGSSGEKQTIWYRYSGPEASAHIGARFGIHTVRATFDWKSLNNRRSVLDRRSEGGVTTTVELTSSGIFRRSTIGSALQYELMLKNLEARADLFLNQSSALSYPMYPYVYTRSQLRYGALLEGVYHLKALDFTARAGVSLGGMEDSSHLAADASGVTSRPDTFQRYKKVMYDDYASYMNRTRILYAASVRYNFKNGLFSEAFADGILSRVGFGIRFGYNF